jgi:hypothetical protein
VGRKLSAAMQATPSDIFLVRVHPDDFARFDRDRAFLEARWSALLREVEPVVRDEAPRAILKEDPRVVAGSVAIEAVLDERPVVLALRTPSGAVALRDGLTIGRAAENDVVVADMRVSRRHATIAADGSGFVVMDAGSSNGTFVDGAPVKRERLIVGSVLTVGDTHLRVVGDAG